MKKYWKALANIGIAVGTLLLLIFVLPKMIIYFIRFVIAWIIALIASPAVRFFEEKIHLRRKAGSAFMIISVIAIVILLLYLIGAKLWRELSDLLVSRPNMWASWESDFSEITKKLSVFINRLPFNFQSALNTISYNADNYIGDFLSGISDPAISAVGSFAKQLPSIIIGTIICLLSSYFFVADRTKINRWCSDNIPKAIQNRYQMVRKSLGHSVGGYFKAQLKIELWIYLFLLIGLSVLKVKHALLIGILIAFLDFLPIFGTGTVLVPWAVIKLLSSDYRMAIGLLVIWGAGQLFRQLIQPKIVGDSVGVAPLPTLFLLYIGFKTGSVIGMIVAVPIGLLLYTMYKEGVFDTTKNSVLILIAGINRFRQLNKDDMRIVEESRAAGNADNKENKENIDSKENAGKRK